jgi:hypothetical protein
MKKITLFLICLVLTGTGIFADGPQPNFFYAPAGIGLLLPDDTEESIDEDDITYYLSESENLLVIIGELEEPMSNADLLNEKKFKAVVSDFEAVYVRSDSNVPEGDLVWNAAVIKMEWEDGSTDQGYFIILNSKDAKKKTFVIGIFTPKLKEDWDNAAYLAYMSLTYAKAPR